MALRFFSDVNILGGLQIGSVVTTNTSMEALIIESGQVRKRALGSMALELTSNFYNKTDSDARFINIATKGQPLGVTPLGSDGKVPLEYLPSYVSEVQEYANLAAFPNPGDTGVIYVALDTNFTYRWGGSTYVQLTGTGVQSVNGETGIVTLTTNDIAEGGGVLYFTESRARNAISGSAPIAYNPSTGIISHNLVFSGAPGQNYNLVTIDAYGHITAAQNLGYLTTEIDTLTSVTGRNPNSTNNFGVSKTTGASAISAASADSGATITALGRPATLVAQNNLNTGTVSLGVNNTGLGQLMFSNTSAQIVLNGGTTGLGIYQNTSLVNQFVGNGQLTGADATAANHFVTRQQVEGNLANAILNQISSEQSAGFRISGTGKVAKLGVGAMPESDVSVDVRGNIASSQGASTLANRTRMSWVTGGGYITGETWSGGSWIKSGMLVAATSTRFEGDVIAEGTGTFQGGGFDSLRSLKQDIIPWQKDAVEMISKIPIYSFRYKSAPDNIHIGLMADEAPKELLMANERVVNTYSSIGILMRAVQQLTERIKQLENART